MDTERARDLLENLLERATSSGDRVFLTSKEIEALAAVLGQDPPPQKQGKTDAEPIPALAAIAVTGDELVSDAMLCIDFGTSFSKAFVSVGTDEAELELIDLPIGDTGSRMTTPSELFIDGGNLYFGTAARRRWNDIEAPADRLIDSIKQFITLNQDVSTIGDRDMPSPQDPSGAFSQRDVLVLYLAHLMALTERALVERGYSPNIRRRFTHPAWKSAARTQNESAMAQLMAEAIVLARSVPEQLVERISVNVARGLLDQLEAVPREALPGVLIGDPVREATAAGAGALMATREGRREAYLVLDIGAGTTDVAGFYCANNPNNERLRVFEVSSAADAKNMAGNRLDQALQRFALGKSGLSPGSTEANVAGHAVRRQIRTYKEQLFRTGQVIIELPTDEIVRVELDEFLADASVQEFNKQITEMVAKSAVALAGDASKVKLVATGGGAGLPIVQQLARAGVSHDGRRISFELANAMPDDVRENYPDLVDPYPQIAVALGGSLPNLPEQKASISTGITQTPKRTMAPVYKS